MNQSSHIERTLINKVYKNGEYFFDDGKREVELIELEIKATQLVQVEAHTTIKGSIAVVGNIKVPMVFTAWFDSGDPFDINIRNAKDGKLELGILGIVFVYYGPDYVGYVAKGFTPFVYPE